MTLSANLRLPYLDAAQAQKHVTHNEALALLDALTHLSVSARNQTDAPTTPIEGQRFLISAAPSGAFSGKPQQVATYLAGAWTFLAPRAGWRVFIEAEKLLLVHDGAGWIDAGQSVKTLQGLSRLGFGATADANNPLLAKLNGALFTALASSEGGNGDLRMTLNKESAARSVSQIYQTNYSGRAETGLTGDDHFHVKVSADGSVWKEAIRIDSSSAVVALPISPLRLASFTKASAPAPATAGAGAMIYVTDTTGGPSLCVSTGAAWKMILLSTAMA